MFDDRQSEQRGIYLCSALFLVLLVLKLCGVVAWSWIWIVAPLWMPVAVLAALAWVFVVAAVIRG